MRYTKGSHNNTVFGPDGVSGNNAYDTQEDIVVTCPGCGSQQQVMANGSRIREHRIPRFFYICDGSNARATCKDGTWVVLELEEEPSISIEKAH